MAAAPFYTDLAPATSYFALPFAANGLCASTNPNTFYISCVNHCLYYLDGPALCTVHLYAGQPHDKGYADGHRLSQATFNFESWNGLCILRGGALLISEGGGHLIRSVKGDQVVTWAGTGVTGLKDGPRLEAQFDSPYQIAHCTALDSVIVCDYSNHRIRLIKDDMVTSIEIRIENPFRFSLCGTILTVSSSLNSFTQLDLERHVSSPTTVMDTSVEYSSMCQLADQSFLVFGTQQSLVVRHLTTNHHSSLGNAWNPTLFKASNLPPLDLTKLHKKTGPTPRTSLLACLDSSRQRLLVIGGRCTLTDLSMTYLAPSVAINPIDLGQLVLATTPKDFAEIHIVNRFSNTDIYLHSLVMEAYTIDLEKLRLVLENSKLPTASLTFFVSTLYSPDSSLEQLELSVDGALELLHGIHLYVSLGISHTNLVLCAANSILPKLTGPEICSLLWGIWQDCIGEDTTTDVLIPFLRPFTSTVANQADEKKHLIVRDLGRYTKFLLQLSTFNPPPVSSSKLVPSNQLAWQIRTIGWSVRWQDCSPEEPTPPGFMRIGIIGNPRELQVNLFVIYASWSFVRRLFESGMSESVSRRLELPLEFPPSLLYALVLSLHGIKYSDHLSMKDCGFLLENLRLYDIEQSPALKPLQDHCRQVVFAPLTVHNCIDALLVRHTIGTDEEIDQVVEFVARSLGHRHVDDAVWDSLPPKLLRDILKAICRLRSKSKFY